jgi:uncharacterized protein YpmB
MKTSRRKSKSNPKLFISILVLVCVLCITSVILLTCNNGVVSSDEALQVVLEDLGVTSAESVSPHVHEGTYENQPCYNVYVTVNGESLTYVVSTTGEILHKGEGGHSH